MKNEMNREENNKTVEEQAAQKKRLSRKAIWLLVLILLLGGIISAAIFIPRLRKAAPTDGEDVITLVPENTGDENGASDENVGTADGAAGGEDADAGEDAGEDIGQDVGRGAGQYAASNTSGTVDNVHRVGNTTTLYSEMLVEDKKHVWRSSTSVDIFRKYYEGTSSAGTEGKITVENDGSDDKKLIAPGTENTYTFWVKNPGETMIDYRVSFREESGSYEIPLQVRVKCGKTYICGSDDTWEEIGRLNSVVHASQLAPRNYARYTLEWRWPYHTDSASDTALGNEATAKDIEQMIRICTYGEGYGTRTTYLLGVKTGDDANIWLWILLAVLGAAAVVYMAGRMSKKRREADE